MASRRSLIPAVLLGAAVYLIARFALIQAMFWFIKSFVDPGAGAEWYERAEAMTGVVERALPVLEFASAFGGGGIAARQSLRREVTSRATLALIGASSVLFGAALLLAARPLFLPDALEPLPVDARYLLVLAGEAALGAFVVTVWFGSRGRRQEVSAA